MKRLNIIPLAIVAALLLACLTAVYLTRDSGTPQSASQPAADESLAAGAQLLDAANQLFPQAQTADEQNEAREAQHLADHQLDQAFATALRQATAYRPPATGPLHDLTEHIDQLKSQIAADQARIAQLGKPGTADASDQLELATAQLVLDQDELGDAQQDLARQGGDPHSALERALQQHEATHTQNSAQSFKGASPTGTLAEQARTWFFLTSLNAQLLAAEQQAASLASTLSAQHSQLEKSSDPSAAAPANTADQIANLHRLSGQRKTLAELDQRVQDSQQLAGVYRTWSTLVQARRRAVAHLLLTSLAEILGIIFLAILASIAIRHLFHESDEKRLHQFRVMAAVAVQFLALIFILLVLFGPPNQLSTIIGLTTAGLTVVLKDVIVSFFGWFTLMGKNGIRIGDWVEINGVGGEVIEIGLLKTVLLELGNWTDTGHPTGRQVAFSNSFAMEGHYFNFSTAGQWLWDELGAPLPPDVDPYLMASEIRKLVEHETEADSAEAAQAWERVNAQYGSHPFTAKPAVSLRPGLHGLEVAVRYITRAPQRNDVRAKLFHMIVDLLHQHAGEHGTEPSPDLTAPQSPHIVREGEPKA